MEAQQSFERRLRRSVALPLALAIVLAAALLWQILYLVSVNRWVDHTDEVIARSNQILRLLVDMETGVRGYLLIGRPEFLEPYDAATRVISARMEELRELVSDNPAQVKRLDAVREKQRDWSGRARGLIERHRDAAAAERYELHSQGKEVMDSLRRELEGFAAVEMELRDLRTRRARAATRRTVALTLGLVLFTGTAVALFARRQLLVVAGSYRDALDERARAEEDLRRLNRELEERVRRRTLDLTEAVKELEAFSYSVSHDLRAPLRSIDGFSQVLLEDYAVPLGEEGQGYLRRVRAASQRMGQLIDDLLMLSRMARGELRPGLVELTALVRGIEAELRGREPQRAVEVVVAPGLTAHGDSHFLRIAFANLLENAWKFTRHRPDARIEVSVQTVDGERVYEVKDNGAGFDMAYAGKLFTPFQRLHRADEFEGTGIGLATVQRVVHRHGGWIRAQGEVGRGATFRFTLGEP